jgi:hypothetical protein
MMRNSAGSLSRNRWVKNMLDSCPLGQISNMAARSSDGLRPPSGSILKNHSLIIIQLVRLQQPLLENRIWVVARQIFHDVQHEADSLLGEGSHQEVISGLLLIDAVEPKPAFIRDEPARRLVHPERRKAEPTEAIRPRLSVKSDEILLVHIHRGHQCKSCQAQNRYTKKPRQPPSLP